MIRKMCLYVCSSEFKTPDREEPWHSLTEIDYYQWIPVKFHKTERNHRLKLWFNYNNQKYELVKDFMDHHENIVNMGGSIGILCANIPNKDREVVFSNENLEAVLIEANELWNYYHGEWAGLKREADKVCQHKFPNRGTFCKI